MTDKKMHSPALMSSLKGTAVSILAALFSGLLICGAHAAEGCASTLGAGASNPVVRTTLAGVPAVIRVPQNVSKPPIILWHGLGPPASESALMAALPLDDVPAVKVYLELPLFGTRAPSGGDAKSLAQRQAEDYALLIFKPIVVGAAEELPAVLEALRGLKCLRPHDSVGLFGFSAGGTAVLIALRNPSIRVRAAVTVNAPTGLNDAIDALERATKKPYTWSEASRQLAKQTDASLHAAEIAAGDPPRALLLFHGADDKVIAHAATVSLGEKLRRFYAPAGNDGRLRIVIAPEVGHDWTADPRTLSQVRNQVADWFNRHL